MRWPKPGRTGIGRGLDALRIGGNLPFIHDRIYRSPKESLQVRWTAADATGDDSAEQRRLSAAPICRLSVISMAARRFSCPCRAQHLPENTRGENEAGLCERTTRRAPMPSIGVVAVEMAFLWKAANRLPGTLYRHITVRADPWPRAWSLSLCRTGVSGGLRLRSRLLVRGWEGGFDRSQIEKRFPRCELHHIPRLSPSGFVTAALHSRSFCKDGC